jgi:hypothetical protein
MRWELLELSCGESGVLHGSRVIASRCEPVQLPTDRPNWCCHPCCWTPQQCPRLWWTKVGTDIPFNLTAYGTSLTIAGAASRWVADTDLEVIWLEYVSPHRYRLVLERSGPLRADAPTAAPPDDAIEFASADRELLRRPMPRLTPVEFHLGLRATQLATHPGFDRLILSPLLSAIRKNLRGFKFALCGLCARVAVFPGFTRLLSGTLCGMAIWQWGSAVDERSRR